MRTRFPFLCFVLYVLVGLPAIGASPDLPPFLAAGTLGTVEGPLELHISAPGTYELGALTGTILTATPMVTARADGTRRFYGFAATVLRYSFTVTGPQEGVLVPMHVKATLQTDATGTGDAVDASAQFVLQPSLFGGPYTAYSIFRQAIANRPQPDKAFSGTLPFDHVAGHIGSVHLQVDVRALDRNGGGVAEATADPFIFIDPAWLSTHPGYTVSVSEGIGNIDPDAPADSTAPVITPTVGGTLGDNDWYVSDVVVNWSVTDDESSISSSSGCEPSTVVMDTAAMTFTCTATSAGGTSSSSVTIKRDATPPVIIGSQIPSANANGWNNGPVAVTFECSDEVSGLAAGSPPSAITLRGDGADQSAGGRCVDGAGNFATANVARVNIDQTAPAVECRATPDQLWPPNHMLVDISLTVTVADDLSGSAGFSLVSLTSNEPESADTNQFAIGTPDIAGQLRAERAGTGAGRFYTFEYLATDKADNTARCRTVVTVPHDQRER